MKKSILILVLLGVFTLGYAQDAAKSMSSRKTITENVGSDSNLSALSEGLKKTPMGQRLEAKGKITFFAVTTDGFNKTLHGGIPKMMSEHYLPMLDKILNYHAVEGDLSFQDLKNKIELGNGTAMLKTWNGESLKLTYVDGKIIISDSTGNKATLVEADIKQSNGVVHIIDTLLLPQGI